MRNPLTAACDVGMRHTGQPTLLAGAVALTSFFSAWLGELAGGYRSAPTHL